MTTVKGDVESSTDGGEDGLAAMSWRPRYSSSEHNLIAEFFVPAMRAATSYDRAVAYFRSTFYSLTSAAAAEFAVRGGRIRLLCAPEFLPSDIAALQAGDDPDEIARRAALAELERIAADPTAARGMAVFDALLRAGALDIRVATLRDAAGIFHDKVGVFADGDANAISFVGSANETWSAWSGTANHESFDVFLSWTLDAERVSAHRDFFERAWAGDIPEINVLPATEAIRAGLVLPTTERDPIEILIEASAQPESPPPPPSPKTLMKHQLAALESWRAADYCGIFEHATGSGKTITALAAIRDHVSLGRPAIVLVPSVLLLDQWAREAVAYLGDLDPSIVLCGGRHLEWRRPGLLRTQTEPGGTESRLTIATLQTAVSDDFMRGLRGSEDLLVVCDEVHRFGAPGYAPLDAITAGRRLGLSATPERFRDPVGTDRIHSYFGRILEPVVTLADAIAAKRLVPYEYHFSTVGLSDDEVAEWHALTDKIARAVAGATDDSALPPHVETLLIQRSRIIKKAGSKVPAAAAIIAEQYRPGAHWLVYCEDTDQVASVRLALEDQGVESMEYRSAMGSDHATVLERFERRGGILVAIRCLDEGIDIPVVSHALILASSQNPREFIQRRGRVLRAHKTKRRAHVFDLVTLPPADRSERFSAMLLAEVARAHEFAKGANNRSALTAVEKVALDWGVDFATFVDIDSASEREEPSDD